MTLLGWMIHKISKCYADDVAWGGCSLKGNLPLWVLAQNDPQHHPWVLHRGEWDDDRRQWRDEPDHQRRWAGRRLAALY